MVKNIVVTLDASEAIGKLKELNEYVEKLKSSLECIQVIASDASKSMKAFSDACSNIRIGVEE